MTVTIYGIKNCDTMKKARAWLESHKIAYAFHDYKRDGVAADRLESFMDALGWETVLNRAGTTFRGLPEPERSGLDATAALRLMLEHPSMIKRPILVRDDRPLMAGFSPERYATALL